LKRHRDLAIYFLYTAASKSIVMSATRKLLNFVFHSVGKITKRYYFEDCMRIYPDGIVFGKFRNIRQATKNDINNFLNHRKFYKFAAQFVKNKHVADIGSGSGYGCEILKKAGATLVCGSDISKHAIKFAKTRYADFAEFTMQGITDMKDFSDDFFEISVCSEVLEHIKEYGMEEKAISELKRITRKEGLLIIGTPNTEMLGSHGFSFDEIYTLFKRNFSQFCIFENALVPFGDAKSLWEKRLAEGKTGVVVTENISLLETVLPQGIVPEIKRGIDAGLFHFATYSIDTTLLHNTHSWVVLAVNSK
jgi:ubiquinone/menaquinone biosynthesis C-methylase UbiE